MALAIGCVVEGHGDRAALPIVIRRIAAQLEPGLHVEIPSPIRTNKSKLIKPGELERAIEAAARMAGGGGVLVLIDSDEDCPAELGPSLLHRARESRGDLPLGVVLAKYEFEAWFLAAAESLRGKRGLPDDLQPPPDPEGIRAAKGWLGQRMEKAHGYVETLDQPAFASLFDLDAARSARSFDKCHREVVGILQKLRGAA